MKSVLLAAATSATLAATSFSAHSATVANLDINGGYALMENGAGNNLMFFGFFNGTADPTEFDTFGDYSFSAKASLNGETILDDTLVVEDTTLTDEIADVSGLIPSIVPAINSIPGVSFVFDFGVTSSSATAVSGLFFGTLDTAFPLGNAVEGLLAGLGLGGLLTPASLATPAAGLGSFDIALSIDVEPAEIAVVPLPATLPLMGAGLMGLWALRRRKTRA